MELVYQLVENVCSLASIAVIYHIAVSNESMLTGIFGRLLRIKTDRFTMMTSRCIDARAFIPWRYPDAKR
jgi:hypothetical protein